MNRNDTAVPPQTTKVQPKSSTSVNSSRPSYSSPKSPKRFLNKNNALLRAEIPLLEEVSFHQTVANKSVWKCSGCGSENLNALRNECSICGMMRADSWHDDSDLNDISESTLGDESLASFGNSYSSLFQNSFSKIEEDEPKLYQSYATMPAVSSSSDQTVVSTRSFRSTLSTRQSRRARERRLESHREGNDDSTVMSFCAWNGNEKMQNWRCGSCTYSNLALHLVCEMCGTRRGHAQIRSEDSDELRYLQEQQMREIVSLQGEMLSSFQQARAQSNNNSSLRDVYDTAAFRAEIDAIENEEEDDNRLEEILEQQRAILMDMQNKSKSSILDGGCGDDDDRKPAAIAPAGLNASTDFFGGNRSNVAPDLGFSLEHSMKAAGGTLTPNDLCMPILWGDDIGSGGKIDCGKVTR